jgi:hypothetical protein
MTGGRRALRLQLRRYCRDALRIDDLIRLPWRHATAAACDVRARPGRDLLVLRAVDDDVPGRRPRTRRAVVRPIDALARSAVVVIAALHVRVVADFHPRPARRVHLTEIAHDLDAIAGRDLDVVVAMFAAARIPRREYARYGSAYVDFLVALKRTGRQLLLVLFELRNVARPSSARRRCRD